MDPIQKPDLVDLLHGVLKVIFYKVWDIGLSRG